MIGTPTIKYTRDGLPGTKTLTFDLPATAKHWFDAIIVDEATITATLYNKAGETVEFYTRDLLQEFFGITK